MKWVAKKQPEQGKLEEIGKLSNPTTGNFWGRLRKKLMPVNFVRGADGLPRVILNEPKGSSAEVLFYGGQVISWKIERREELLFMSSKPLFLASVSRYCFTV
ncbi:putative glucose-6-phosphate 1-epimerase [Drosera capensis]